VWNTDSSGNYISSRARGRFARELGVDRKTVRKCIARGLEPPVYGPRKPRKRLIDPFVPYLRGRVVAYPGPPQSKALSSLQRRGRESRFAFLSQSLMQRSARVPLAIPLALALS
jgi:transposase